MSENGKRRSYDWAFKVEAVRLVSEERRRVTEVARNLGINPNQLHRWKSAYGGLSEEGQLAFPGKGHLLPDQEELRRLRRELADVTEERDILKKALAVFSSRRR